MLEGVDQVVVGPAIDVEPGVAAGPELLQVVLPLLLVINGVPLHHLPDLIANTHILTLSRPRRGRPVPPESGLLVVAFVIESPPPADGNLVAVTVILATSNCDPS